MREAPNKILRRPKQDPVSDMMHTLRVGGAIAAILFIALPFVFDYLWR